jgi:hypothetical protein
MSHAQALSLFYFASNLQPLDHFRRLFNNLFGERLQILTAPKQPVIRLNFKPTVPSKRFRTSCPLVPKETFRQKDRLRSILQLQPKG